MLEQKFAPCESCEKPDGKPGDQQGARDENGDIERPKRAMQVGGMNLSCQPPRPDGDDCHDRKISAQKYRTSAR
jgi:hypothetical protein